MSSQPPEGPSNPGDWQSPYGSPGHGGPGPYGGQEPQDAGYESPPPGYGPPPGYQQPPPGYGPPYGQQPYGYGAPPHPRSDGTRTHAIVALVISIILAMSCYVSLGGIAGAILSGIALSKADFEPARANNLLKWCWVSIGINVALLIIGVAAFIIAGVNGAFD